jgi:hypothetical protein
MEQSLTDLTPVEVNDANASPSGKSNGIGDMRATTAQPESIFNEDAKQDGAVHFGNYWVRSIFNLSDKAPLTIETENLLL